MEKISWSRARFALKPHPFWARARGTRRGLRSNHTHCVRKLKMAGGYFEVEAMVRGYHQYKEIWNASIGEVLAEPLHVCSTPTLAHIVKTARASSIITEAWSRFDSRFFVCKYFVVRLSTTKTTKILPLEKYPLYGIMKGDGRV